MSKAKKDINQNFEMLKAQMQAKRQKAETQSEKESKINTEVIDIKGNAKEEELSEEKKEVKKEKESEKKKNDIPITEEKISKVKEASEPLVAKTKKNVEVQSILEDEEEIEENFEDEEEIEEIVVKKPRKKRSTPKKKVIEVYEEDELDDEEDEFEEFDQDDELITTSNSGTIKIKIKKQEKPEAPRRATYYLKQETIRKIEKVSKMSGIGKSKLVQLLLDQALDNLEIEK